MRKGGGCFASFLALVDNRRRFPAPRYVREPEQAFVRDANGQAVAYTYFRRDENEARQPNVLTYDEAPRIAANIAKLPGFLSRKGKE